MKIAVLFTAVLALVAPVHASVIVVPNFRTATPGNDSSGSLGGAVAGIFESQDVFAKTQFPSGGSLLITQIAFRLKPGTGGINSSVTSISLSLSTTQFGPNTSGGTPLLTTTFATNRGPDNTVVAFGGPGTLFSSAGCTGLVTCPFDIVIPFSTPFLYNPANGFLLMDMTFTGYQGVGTGEFDVENYNSSPGTAAVAEITALGGGPTGALEFSDSITQFTFTQVPEPESWGLLLSGLGALAVMFRRR